MPRGTSYANNSYNQSLGRVGMAMGSAPVSRSSGGGSSSGGGGSRSYGGGSSGYASSSGTTNTYVDNSYNRSVGRVGMERGSMPISKGSSSSGSTSSSACNTYVDNSYNRNLGRVGMERGSMPVSRDSSSSGSVSSSASTKTYVDNSYNRSLGRVGMKLGSMSVSKGSENTNTYVDNAYNRSLGRVGMKRGSMSLSKDSKTVMSSDSKKTQGTVKTEPKLYADNAMNRKLGRANQPFGSMPVSSKKTETGYMQNAYDHMVNNPNEEFHPPFTAGDLDELLQQRLTEMFNRMELSRNYELAPVRSPFEWYEGPVIQFNDLQIGKIIGHGGFGDVHHAKLKGKEVAVKKLRVQRVSQRKLSQFEEEVRVFCKLQHKNIITFYGACITTPNLCIVMEFMEGSLYDKLHIEQHQFSVKDQKFIAMEIADGLVYLHSENVAHCDMKPTNVLINVGDDIDKHEVKITDFGLSKMKNYADSSRSARAEDLVKEVGTPRYSAPEVLRGEFLDTKGMMFADVYSFGLVMFEIFSGEEAFDDYNAHQLKKHIGNGDHKPDVAGLELSRPLQKLMLKCWVRNPTERPTAKQCVLSLKKAD
ncbi:dual specificity protein kinase splB-like [Anneissia japonica]|uniref:dual specificity protein kinase splB-like n=1 Tax=Anneissia japonica TaxID=1529436 RepID=UPI0014258423|nr:dual specificity protein kinase splB-like [Anneissia japonica]XP_033110196.1 dual specificity protein kinase splB-like [Anneissia japonica]